MTHRSVAQTESRSTTRPCAGDCREGATPDHHAFLFTDLVGSTRLWEADPDRMEAALIRHDDILEQTIGAYGGRVFKWTGDGCCAVFPLPGLAPQAAVAIRAAFLDPSWNSEPALSIRIALHAGPVRPRRAHDFVGRTLNQAARLLDICADNQILATTEVVDAVCRCGRGTAWRSLGTRELRDIERPLDVVDVEPALAAVHDLPTYRRAVV